MGSLPLATLPAQGLPGCGLLPVLSWTGALRAGQELQLVGRRRVNDEHWPLAHCIEDAISTVLSNAQPFVLVLRVNRPRADSGARQCLWVDHQNEVLTGMAGSRACHR